MSEMSLYIHIPFCERKCFYCSFVVSIGHESKIDSYLKALDVEASEYEKPSIKSIFIGGGTPSVLNPAQLKTLFNLVRKNFIIDKNAEWTFEANPESVNLGKGKLLKDLGVNRVSLGLQSLNEKYLKYLGRNHSLESGQQAFSNLKKAEFENISVDLMYGFPGQTQQELKEDINAICDLNSDHVSIYFLTIEENSRFFVKKEKLDNDHYQRDLFVDVVKEIEGHGFTQYEISNFSKPGKQSRHNINYWQGGNYIGLGVGAHSHVNGRRYWNVDRIQEYLSLIGKTKKAVSSEEMLNREQQFMETLIFGLRMNEGIDLKDLEKRYSVQISNDVKKQLMSYHNEGLIAMNGTKIKTTLNGQLVLDEISTRLI